eukprot:391423-Prorocentrum_lima.AAC.1
MTSPWTSRSPRSSRSMHWKSRDAHAVRAGQREWPSQRSTRTTARKSPRSWLRTWATSVRRRTTS